MGGGLASLWGNAVWAQAGTARAQHGVALTAREVAARIDARCNSMRTLTAEFTEIYSSGGIERTESGTLKIKKPGKMRWDYAVPRDKVFVTDGKTAWFYVPGERQARRTPIKRLDDLRSPLRFLLGHAKLEKELRGLSLAPDVPPENPGDVVLRGIPVGMEDRISEVLLECDSQGYLRRIYMQELDGSTTEFQLSAQREDVAISDAVFHFKPPAGVEVLRAEQLQP